VIALELSQQFQLHDLGKHFHHPQLIFHLLNQRNLQLKKNLDLQAFKGINVNIKLKKEKNFFNRFNFSSFVFHSIAKLVF